MARNNFHVNDGNLLNGQGIVLGAVSNLVTGVAADADVFGFRNINAQPLAISMIRIRWATTAAFTSAQSMIFSVSKVYGFTAIHDTAGKAIQAHYKNQDAEETYGTRAGAAITTGDRVPATEMTAYISDTAAITGATYTAEDTDEPEVFAVGAGSTLPGVYEDYCPAAEDGLPLVLMANEGLVVNVRLAMGAGGVGRLFVGLDGFRML